MLDAGTWGLVIIDSKNPDQMIVCRHGSPLVVGYNDYAVCVASEVYKSFYLYLNEEN